MTYEEAVQIGMEAVKNGGSSRTLADEREAAAVLERTAPFVAAALAWGNWIIDRPAEIGKSEEAYARFVEAYRALAPAPKEGT